MPLLTPANPADPHQRPITVYVSIGNSDDKLPQAEWSAFCHEVDVLANAGQRKHGQWVSPSSSPWQNACWCIEVLPGQVDTLKAELRELAAKYRQDSIAWAIVFTTEFLAP